MYLGLGYCYIAQVVCKVYLIKCVILEILIKSLPLT